MKIFSVSEIVSITLIYGNRKIIFYYCKFFLLNIRIQDLYRSWAALDNDKKYPQGIFLDYLELPILQQLNSDLLEYKADDLLFVQL